jgi:hypothetical protein
VRRIAAALLFVLLLAHASLGRAGGDRCRNALYTGDLGVLFVPPRLLGHDWESVRESPADPGDDPELRAAAVIATKSLHYTRAQPGGSEVCSLEIWAFASDAAARRAQEAFRQPRWRFDLRGNLLLMSRGVSFTREHGFRPGLLPACHRLADLAEAAARERLGCAEAAGRSDLD